MAEKRFDDVQVEGAPPVARYAEGGEVLSAKERLLRLQEQDVAQQWESTVGLVLNANEKDPKYVQQFSEFIYKLYNSRMSGTGKEPGNWMHMVFDMVADESLSQTLDTYASLDTLHFTAERWGKGREEYLLREWEALGVDPEKYQGKEEKIFLLQKLLVRTQWQLEQNPGEWNSEEYATLVATWSTILKRFCSARVFTIRARMEQQLPDILATKEKLLAAEGEGVDSRAVERVQNTPVLFGDEYVEYGTLYQHGRGVYMLDARPPYVRVTGQTSLNPAQVRTNVSHELHHVRSGHEDAVVEIDTNGQEKVTVPRLGIFSEAEPGTHWLNEAETEERNGRLMKIPNEKQTYPFSRQLKAVLMDSLQIDQADLNAWYEVEGDDAPTRQRLQEKYPDLFPILREVDELRARIFEDAKFAPGFYPFERMGTKDFQKIIDFVKSKKLAT